MIPNGWLFRTRNYPHLYRVLQHGRRARPAGQPDGATSASGRLAATIRPRPSSPAKAKAGCRSRSEDADAETRIRSFFEARRPCKCASVKTELLRISRVARRGGHATVRKVL